MMDFDKALLIFKSVMTLIFLVIMSFIEPVFLYIAGASVIITIPIILSFGFIKSLFKSEDKG